MVYNRNFSSTLFFLKNFIIMSNTRIYIQVEIKNFRNSYLKWFLEMLFFQVCIAIIKFLWNEFSRLLMLIEICWIRLMGSPFQNIKKPKENSTDRQRLFQEESAISSPFKITIMFGWDYKNIFLSFEVQRNYFH